MNEKKKQQRYDKKLSRKISKTIKRNTKEDFSVMISRIPGASSFRVMVHDGDNFALYKVSLFDIAILADGLEKEMTKK